LNEEFCKKIKENRSSIKITVNSYANNNILPLKAITQQLDVRKSNIHLTE